MVTPVVCLRGCNLYSWPVDSFVNSKSGLLSLIPKKVGGSRRGVHHGGVAWRPISDVDARLEAAYAHVCHVGWHRDTAHAIERRARSDGGLRQRWEEQRVPEQQMRRRHCDQSNCGGIAVTRSIALIVS
jgi:hypothetical protein